MKQKQNLIGKSFGKLVVIAEAPNSKNKNDMSPYWRCKCECGNETNVRSYALTHGITTTCGNIKHRARETHYKWTGYGEISGHFLCDIKKGAKRRNLSFSVTPQDLWELFLKQQRRCALTGVILEFGCGKRLGTASLDRINSAYGYEKNNIQWVHKEMNFLKSNYSEQQFKQICKAVINYTELGIPADTSLF